jgi:hypothetical protein
MNTPAFPTWSAKDVVQGMTLRDYFAAAAMQGLLSTEYFRGMPYKLVAEDAYRAADAMMEARDAT